MRARSKAATIRTSGSNSRKPNFDSGSRKVVRVGETSGTLFIVPTPIGNLEDISLRVIRVLKEADVVLAEDTRKALKLLNHLEIKTNIKRYDLVNELRETTKVLQLLAEGKNVALTSSAGTPGISDPGYLLVRAARDAGTPVISLPGPSACITALAGSGFASEQFVFLGFLPRRIGERKKVIVEAVSGGRTVVFYESPKRVRKTVSEIEALFPARKIAVCRELTKVFETYYVGLASEILIEMADEPKGEHVVIIKKAVAAQNGQSNLSEQGDSTDAAPHELTEKAEKFVQKNVGKLTSKEMTSELIERFNLTKNAAYELILKVKRGLLR